MNELAGGNSATLVHLRRFQHGLWTLFSVVLAVSLVSVVFAGVKVIEERWTAFELKRNQEQMAFAELRNLGGIVDDFGDGALVQLGGTKVSDPHLVVLKRVYSVKYISLYETAVTDAGLVHLRDLKNLQRLDLSHTQVTPKGIASLQEALPGVAIYQDEN